MNLLAAATMARGNRTARQEEDETPIEMIDNTVDTVPTIMSDVEHISHVLIKRDKMTLAIKNEEITEFNDIMDCQRRFGQFTFVGDGRKKTKEVLE